MKDHDSINFEKKDDTAIDQAETLRSNEDMVEKEINKAAEDSEKSYERKKDEIEWDGSESEFVEDHALEYEEKYSGIKFSYTLKKEEISACVKYCGINRKVKIAGSILLGAFTLVYLLLYISNRNFISLIWFLAGVVLFLLWIFNVLPLFFERFNTDKFPGNKKLSVEVFPDCISVDNGFQKWDILLDGTSEFKEFNNMFLIFIPKQKVFIIPKRAIEPDFLADIEAMLFAGTEPYK